MPPHDDMDKIDKDPELHDLVITLLTRIGMIMEDIIPFVLDATPFGVQGRVVIVAGASARITALVMAVQALIKE